MDKKTGKNIGAIHPGKLGNTNALKGGLYSPQVGPKLRSRRVRRMVSRMYQVMPWLQETDKPAVRSWAELELIGAMVFGQLATDGVTNGNGSKRLLTDWRLLKLAQLAYERDLGMTPASRAALGLDVARGKYYGDLATRVSRIRNGNDDH